MKLDHFLIPYTSKNPKWIKDLNLRPRTIKILEESTGSNVSNIGCRSIFLDMSPEARETKAKINYWDFIKIKKKVSAQQRKQSTKLEGNLQNGRRHLQMTYLTRVSIQIYEELIKLNTHTHTTHHTHTHTKTKIQFKKWAENMNRQTSF